MSTNKKTEKQKLKAKNKQQQLERKAQKKQAKIKLREEKQHLRIAKATKRIKNHTPFQLFMSKLIIILCLVCVMMGFGFFGWKKGSEVTVTKSYAMVKESLTYWQEFVTLKYQYSDIVSIKKENFFTTSYSLVKYKGIVRAGIADITECKINISKDQKSLKITLPDAEILGNEIENQEVFDEKHSIFIPLTLGEVFTEIEKSKNIALEEILQQGILEEAKNYAKKILTQIFLTAGFESVVVE